MIDKQKSVRSGAHSRRARLPSGNDLFFVRVRIFRPQQRKGAGEAPMNILSLFIEAWP